MLESKRHMLSMIFIDNIFLMKLIFENFLFSQTLHPCKCNTAKIFKCYKLCTLPFLVPSESIWKGITEMYFS